MSENHSGQAHLKEPGVVNQGEQESGRRRDRPDEQQDSPPNSAVSAF
jgi:hypothetical protein